MAYLEQTEAKAPTDNSHQISTLNLVSLLSDNGAAAFKPQSDEKVLSPPEPTHLTFSDLPGFSLSRNTLTTTTTDAPAGDVPPTQGARVSAAGEGATADSSTARTSADPLAKLNADTASLSAAEKTLTKDTPGSAQFTADEKQLRTDAQAVVIDMGNAKDLYPSNSAYQKQWTAARTDLASMDSNLWNIENHPTDSAVYKQNLAQLFQDEPQFQSAVQPLVNSDKTPAKSASSDGLTDVIMSTPSAADIGREIKDGLSFGTVRLWDDQVKMDQLEKDPQNWNNLTDMTKAAHDNGKQVMYTFGQSGQDKPVPTVASVSAFAETLAKWSAAHKQPPNNGGIDTYELWNEPNAKGFFSGTPQQLAQLNAAMITQIKKYDPTAKIASPAVSFDGSEKALNSFEDQYFTAMGKLGVLKDIQQVDFHGYQTPTQQPEQVVQDIADMRQIQSQFGLSKTPLVDSEDSFGKDAWVPNAQTQADYVAEKFIMEKAEGITPGYYGFGNNEWGSLTTDGTATGNPTETVQAWKEVNSWLNGATISNLKETGDVWTAEVMRNGKEETIAWAASGTAEYNPGGDYSDYQNLNGTTTKFRGSIKLGQDPILLGY